MATKARKVSVEIKRTPLSSVTINPDNPRQISDQNFQKLVKSLTDFPDMLSIREIVVDENLMCIGGNMRVLALREIGATDCIAKVVTGLTPRQKREFIIKDNSNFGEYDFDILANAWDDLPLTEWGVDLPEDWLAPIPETNKEIDEESMAETEHECPKCGFKW